MSATALLKVMDIAITAMNVATTATNVATRANALIETARSEGREVTDDEVAELVAESDKRRAAWNEAIGK